MEMLMENIVPNTPLIPDEDLQEAFAGMKDYIFITNEEDGSKTFVCSHCGKTYNFRIPQRTYTIEQEDLFHAGHRSFAACTECGFSSEVINTGRKKRLSDLTQEKAVAFVVPICDTIVCLRCEFLYKDFTRKVARTGRQSYEMYRFQKGEETEYYLARPYYQDFIKIKKLRNPFGRTKNSGFSYSDFQFIGLERLKDTFFKYSLFRKAGYQSINCDIFYLSLYARYPEKVEMLLKCGYVDLLGRKIKGNRTKHVVKWEADSISDFWKIRKEERKEWARYANDMEVIDAYLKLFRGCKNGMEQANSWKNLVPYYCSKDIISYIERYRLSKEEFLRYFERDRKRSVYQWKDYIDAATEIGYDLTIHNVVFPKNLTEAHDEAVRTRKIKALETEQKKAAERFDKLMLIYGWEQDGYFIRPPHDCQEIIDEGKELQHCVGGYAARHAEGITTILFMRSMTEPDKPLYTIEIRGKQLIQVHGFKNKTAPSDIPEAKKFFDNWLSWVEKGSKRQKKSKNRKEKERTALPA